MNPRNVIRIILGALLAATAFAQPVTISTPQNWPATFIKGDLQIRFNTRTQLDGDKPKAGVEDVYTLNVNVSNSARFRGTINYRPSLKGTVGFGAQDGQIAYKIDLDVVNPANPAQSKNVGNLYGTVPIDPQNVYHFEFGEPKVSVFGVGSAKGFESKFTGSAAGKPPVEKEGTFAKLQKQAMTITRQVKGETVSLSVTKFDRMDFKGHQVAAGPVQIYPEVVFNGPFIYDYARTAWYFDGLTVTYPIDGRLNQDKITGNIRWDQSRGEYQFDIRVNEPVATESAVFKGAATEADFFATDTSIASLTGTMKYKDSLSGEVVTASSITIDLTGNQLTKQQTMYLCKLLFLSSIVPLNAE